MSRYVLHDIALRKLAKQIRLLSVDCGGEDVYVYLIAGVVEVSRRFRVCDDFVGTYNSCSNDTNIVHDLLEAAWSELAEARV